MNYVMDLCKHAVEINRLYEPFHERRDQEWARAKGAQEEKDLLGARQRAEEARQKTMSHYMRARSYIYIYIYI